MPDSATQSDNQVAIVRTFDAPPEQVWEAWVDPAQVAQWWGPDGFETPLDSVVIELRPGGRYDLLMVDTAPAASSRCARRSSRSPRPSCWSSATSRCPSTACSNEIVTRIEFHAHEGGTRLEVTGGPYPAEMGAFAELGWGQQFDKLGRVLSA